MDNYKLKFTRLQNQILRFLCIKSGLDLNQREIAKALKASPTAISKSLPLLEKENLIKINKNKTINLNLITWNRDSSSALVYKKVENLRILYDSGLPDFLFNEFPGTTIILFGSYARGDDMNTSDIDIAIIGSTEKKVSLNEFKKKLEKSVNINFYDSFKNIHKNLKNNILNGIVLSGNVEI